MSTDFADFLYYVNQITDVIVTSLEYFSDRVHFNVIYKSKELCPCCGYHEHSYKGVKIRKLRMIPLRSDLAAFINVKIHRLKCLQCGKIFWPILPFVRGKKRFTISFERHVMEVMKFSTIEHAAKFLKVSWSYIKDIHKTYLKRQYESPNLESLRYVGVDEFSLHKGRKYMTIFINLQNGQIIHAIEGKSEENVTPFILNLQQKALQLKAIAMDMNAAYPAAVKKHLPNVDVVFDRFHVVALLNGAIEDIRRDQQARCNAAGLKVLKGMRFLLLSNYERLDLKKQNSLDCLLEVNKPIATAHAMKEQIRLFWTKPSVNEGLRFLGWWIMDAIETGIDRLQIVARTLLRHAKGLLNYFKHRITNAKTEGINNKIKTMKRQAYGFRDMEYFKLRLYSLHEMGYRNA